MQDENSLKQLLREVAEGNETALEVAQELLGKDAADGRKVTLAVQRRRLNAEQPLPPPKAPSPRREHVFFNSHGFTAYLSRFGGKDTVVLADPEAQVVFAVLDEKATAGFEVVKFSPLVHPLFAPWAAVLNTGDDDARAADPCSGTMPLRAFVQFLTENRRQIIEPPGRDLLMTLQQVRMSRKVDLAQGFGTKSVNGLMIETAIQGQAGKGATEPVDLPDVLVIRAPLYVATPDRKMEIDLSLSAADDGAVQVRLASGDVPVCRVEVFDILLAEIKDALKDMTVGMGRPLTRPWDTVPRSA